MIWVKSHKRNGKMVKGHSRSDKNRKARIRLHGGIPTNSPYYRDYMLRHPKTGRLRISLNSAVA